MMKKYVDYWMYGVGIGMVWYLFSLWFWHVPGQGREQILVTVIGSGLMGLSAKIYDSQNKPSLYQGVAHFIVILTIVVTMTFLNGWLSLYSLPAIAGFFLQFLGIYAVIWLIIYFWEKKTVKKINQRLKN